MYRNPHPRPQSPASPSTSPIPFRHIGGDAVVGSDNIKTPTLTGTAGSYVLLLLSMFGMYLDKKDTYSFSEFNLCAFYGSRYFEIWIYLIPNNLCLPRLGQSIKGTQFQKKMK